MIDEPENNTERKKSPVLWIVLALWFAWLLALVVLSYPEWGKSKIELLQPADHEK